MVRAEQLARKLIEPQTADPPDNEQPLDSLQKEKMRVLIKKFVTPTRDLRHEIRTLVDVLSFTDRTTTIAEEEGLWDEFRSTAREHPQEVIEECGGDLAQKARETLMERAFPECQIEQAGLAVQLRVLREELAGPKPSVVEWHLADAVALAWADQYCCMIERDRLTDTYINI
jgi:hypothetical protein